jgi:glycosyltransferase involved in cell wall biosynthesis
MPIANPEAPPAGLSAALNADVWVVLPAFNEEALVGRTVEQLRLVCSNIVVVDDGSHDRTAQAALAAGAVVARHVLNLGQGAALQTGLDYALSRGAAYVATFDADGQHDPNDLARMLDRIRSGDIEVALGSRFLGRADGLPWRRRLVLKAAILLTRLTTGLRLTDAHNGLRVLTASAARRLQIVQDQMAHASELVAEIARLGLRYEEVPVTITYSPYSLEKGQRLSGSVRILTDLLVGWLLR